MQNLFLTRISLVSVFCFIFFFSCNKDSVIKESNFDLHKVKAEKLYEKFIEVTNELQSRRINLNEYSSSLAIRSVLLSALSDIDQKTYYSNKSTLDNKVMQMQENDLKKIRSSSKDIFSKLYSAFEQDYILDNDTYDNLERFRTELSRRSKIDKSIIDDAIVQSFVLQTIIQKNWDNSIILKTSTNGLRCDACGSQLITWMVATVAFLVAPSPGTFFAMTGAAFQYQYCLSTKCNNGGGSSDPCYDYAIQYENQENCQVYQEEYTTCVYYIGGQCLYQINGNTCCCLECY